MLISGTASPDILGSKEDIMVSEIFVRGGAIALGAFGVALVLAVALMLAASCGGAGKV